MKKNELYRMVISGEISPREAAEYMRKIVNKENNDELTLFQLEWKAKDIIQVKEERKINFFTNMDDVALFLDNQDAIVKKEPIVCVVKIQEYELKGCIKLLSSISSFYNKYYNRELYILAVYNIQKQDKVMAIAQAFGSMGATIKQEISMCIIKSIGVENVIFENENKLEEIVKNEICTNDLWVCYSDKRYVKTPKVLLNSNIGYKPYLDNDKVYLITGGLGSLGMLIAKQLVKEVKANIILTGRRTPSQAEEEELEKLRKNGSVVQYVRCNLDNEEEVENLISVIKDNYLFINGIFYTAGICIDKLLVNKNEQEMEQVLASKIKGVVTLDELTQKEKLDFFVMFSSVCSVIGNVGQTDYAFANGFLDSYAFVRNTLVKKELRSGSTISINWPFWKEGNMRPDDKSIVWMKENIGFSALPTEKGISFLFNSIKLPYSQVMVTYGNRQKIENSILCIERKEEEDEEQLDSVSSKIQVSEKNFEEEILMHTIKYLKNIFALETKIDVTRIDENEQLEKYGLDSVLIINLTRVLEKQFGVLSKTLFYEYQTIQQLAQYFIKNKREAVLKILKKKSIKQEAFINREILVECEKLDEKEETMLYDKDIKIAVIGISGKYPLADDLEEFWENLKSGKDCITEIPESRFTIDDIYSEKKENKGTTYSKWGGFIDGVDEFDPLIFNISPREAKFIDPQERLFLESAWHTFEDAGYPKKKISGKKVGVYVGVMYGQYQLIGVEESAKGNYMLGNSSFASIANRVSFYFNLHGPSIALDTMCSSSLSAIHLAINSLKTGECEMALAGGVNLTLHRSKYLQLSEQKFASTNGRCMAFGDGGDGYVPGEGVGSILLKPYEKAVEDNDMIYAIVRASVINHGGRTNGYTVPNPVQQGNLIQTAINKANISASDIKYIEAHGTGTALGDPIEINGLLRGFQDTSDLAQNSCAIGSVKSNIGHLESAAGIASITKVILQLQHNYIVPSLHSEILNSNINFSETPFYVPQKLEQWKAQIGENNILKPRFAGISAFGAGGANAHIIIEEHLPNIAVECRDLQCDKEYIIPFSAQTKESLIANLNNMVKYLEIHKNDIELADLSYTLLVGREVLKERVVFLVSDMYELLNKIKAYISNETGMEFCSINNSLRLFDIPENRKDEQEMLYQLIKHNNYRNLCYAWVYMKNPDFEKFSNKLKAKIIHLPGYVFAKTKCWLPVKKHDWLEFESDSLQNKDIKKLTIKWRFDSYNILLNQHRVNRIQMLPAAAYIEMSYRVMRHLLLKNYKIQSIVWISPFIVEETEKKELLCSVQKDGENYKLLYKSGLHNNESVHAICNICLAENSVEEIRYDIPRLKSESLKTLSHNDIYKYFNDVSIEYGKYFRANCEVFCSEQEAVAKISIGEKYKDFSEECIIPVNVLDASFQSTIGILSLANLNKKSTMIPYAIGSVDFYHKISKIAYSYIRMKSENRFDIDLLDTQGKVCVTIRDFQVRSIQPTINVPKENLDVIGKYFVQEWKSAGICKVKKKEKLRNVVIFYQKESMFLAKKIQTYCEEDSNSMVCINENVNYDEVLKKDTKHIYFLAGFFQNMPSLKEAQEYSIIAAFRMVKSIIKSGLCFRDISITNIGNKTLKLFEENMIIPYAAANFGFFKSFAKEYRKCVIKNYDLKCEENNVSEDVIEEIVYGVLSKNGEEAVHRNEKWYQRKLVEVVPNTENADVFRKQGTYVILGGAGGIGLTLCKKLVEDYRAQVILVGRSSLSKEKEERINQIKGNTIDYIRADASDLEEMKTAISKIKQKYGAINGVIHSAIVLEDHPLTVMDEACFRRVLAPKIEGTINLFESVKQEKLDFFMFFSSMQSLTCNAAQSNYSAGCAFKDAFANYIDSLKLFPVKIINWGYWGQVGVVSAKEYNDKLRSQGIYSITQTEGMRVVATLLNNPYNQLMYMKAEKNVYDKLGICENEKYIIYSKNENSIFYLLDKFIESVTYETQQKNYDASFYNMIDYMLSYLVYYFKKINVFDSLYRGYEFEELVDEIQVIPMYYRLFDEILEILKKNGYIHYQDKKIYPTHRYMAENSKTVTELLQYKQSIMKTYPNIYAQMRLLGTCIENLEDIISGRVLATEIMFPNGSMELLNDIYKGNDIVDKINDLAVNSIEKYIELRLRELEDGEKISILEVGSGTGGTSYGVLKTISKWADKVNYCYTDISLGFINYGRKTYGKDYPFVEFKLLDIEKNVAEQGYEVGKYDIVLAANVIHATKNLNNTLENVKCLLKRNGWFILNEATQKQDFLTLTFGLTEGWWLYEDHENRLKNAPLLNSNLWKSILLENGYKNVAVLGGEYFSESGVSQNIIIAESDGRVRIRSTKNKNNIMSYREIMERQTPTGSVMLKKNIDNSNRENEVCVKQAIKESLSNILQIDEEQIDNQIPFNDLGVDSIMAVEVINALNDKLNIKLNATDLFNYSTIDELAKYICEEFSIIVNKKLDIEQECMNDISNIETSNADNSNEGNEAYVKQAIKESFSNILQIDEEQIDNQTPFNDLGVDSIMAIEVINALNDELNIKLNATDLFNYSTIDELTKYICEEFSIIVNKRLDIEQECMNDISNIEITKEYINNVIMLALEEVLQVESQQIGYNQPFSELGIDSIMSVEVINIINYNLKINLQAIDLFNYSTIETLTNYIYENFNVAKGLKKVVETTSDNSINNTTDGEEKFIEEVEMETDIAVVGVSGYFPDADDIGQLWDNLCAGRNSVYEISRWKDYEFFSEDSNNINKSYSKWGGFLKDIKQFDPHFFGISPKEAELMDPQQRLFLMEAWKAFEDAGYSQNSLDGQKCGIYVGCGSGDYRSYLRENNVRADAYSFMGNDDSILASRIAYILNLKGESIAINTACSSSLLAIHMACESIRNGKAEVALAGGVTVLTTPEFYIMASRAGMLSPTGECRAFDQLANGFVPGEGVGAVVLKSLKAARRDHDHIYAVIMGSGTNQDGKTNGITAPSAPSQASLEKEVYEKYNINPQNITYIETHGTGTKLGDPIEITALTEVFAKYTSEKQYCALGSIKTNIGHTLSAAGISSFIKVILCLKNKTLVPSIHLQKENEYINFKDSPFYVNTKLVEWKNKKNKPLQAAISSFGFSGTNVHMVLREYIEKPIAREKVDNKCYPIMISTKNRKVLYKNVEKLLHWLETTDNVDIGNLSYTLATARNHFKWRIGWTVKSIEELVKKMKSSLDNWESNITEYSKQISHDKIDICKKNNILEQNFEDKDSMANVCELMDCYRMGIDVDFSVLFRQEEYFKISIPSHVFKLESFWPNIRIVEKNLNENKPKIQLHPLIDKNVSSFSKHIVETFFSGNEYYINEHVVGDQKIFLGVAHIEMARATGELLLEEKINSIQNVTFLRPVTSNYFPCSLQMELHKEKDKICFNMKNKDDKLIFTSGELDIEVVTNETIDISRIISNCPNSVEKKDLYEGFEKKGIHYGASFRSIEWIVFGEQEAIAKIELPKCRLENFSQYILHPSILDAALQSITGLIVNTNTYESTIYLPFYIGKIRILKPITSICYAYVKESDKKRIGESKHYTIYIANTNGEVEVVIDNFSLRAIGGKEKEKNKEMSDKLKKVFLKDVWRECRMNFGDEIEKNIFIMDASSSINVTKLYDQNISVYTKEDLCVNKEEIFGQANLYIELNDNLEYNDSNDFRSMESTYNKIKDLSQVIKEAIKWRAKGIAIVIVGDKNNPLITAIGGMLRVIAAENRCIRFCVIHIREINWGIKQIAWMKTELNQDELFTEVRYENGLRYVKDLETVDLAPKNNFVQIRQNGIYMITGGMGGIGTIFAKYFLKKGAKVILIGRSTLNDEREDRLKQLAEIGPVIYKKVNLTNREEVSIAMQEIQSEYPVIHGIIHCAGVINDGLFKDCNTQDFDSVILPKIHSIYWLDEALKNCKLDFFFLCSSIVAKVANIGQSIYGYANCVLDEWAKQREILRAQNIRHGVTVSVNWPMWKNGGMGISKQKEDNILNMYGLKPIEDKIGMEVFDIGIQSGESNFMFLHGIEEQMDLYCQQRKYETTELEIEKIKPNNNVIKKESVINEVLVDAVAEILKIKREDIDFEESLSDFGFDSISFTDFCNYVNSKFNTQITPSEMFEFKNLEQVKEYLCKEIDEQVDLYCQQRKYETTELELEGIKLNDNVIKKESVINEILVDAVVEILKIKREDIDFEESLSDFGFDSISFTDFCNYVNSKFNTQITPSEMFEFKNLEQFKEYLCKEVDIKIEKSEELSQVILKESNCVEVLNESNFIQKNIEDCKVAQHLDDTDAIAIIGMSGQFPQSEDLEEFWENIKDEKELITTIPSDRWDWKEFYGDPKTEINKTNIIWGGFMKSPFRFDPLFFGISPKEAELMDPQQRIMIECVWNTIEDAGYKVSELSGKDVGLYIGVSTSDYSDLIKAQKIDNLPQISTGNSHSMLANRISYMFDFHGPSMAIDTACSSALVALHTAAVSLQKEECSVAIVGGVNVIVSPSLYISFSKSGMLSEDGKCKTFDESANGYARGEGVGTLMLKKLSDAVKAGDNIYGVIRASAVNHGGHSHSLTAPNPDAQADLIYQAWTQSGIESETIGYIETHGTGTSLGDPIEINGLKKAFTKLYERKGKSVPTKAYCGIGSVKSNIGHLEAASGIAGIIKVLLAMRYKKIPASIHVKNINPYIKLEDTPFYIVNHTSEWKSFLDSEGNPLPRRAGISSFGFGGVNAHVVVEEYDEVEKYNPYNNIPKYVVPISAKTEEQRIEYVKKILLFLMNHPEVSVDTISYVFATGREEFEYRVLFIVDSKEKLIENMKWYLQNRKTNNNIFEGYYEKINGKKIFLEEMDGNLEQIAKEWVNGAIINWRYLYKDNIPKKFSLPTYPFATEEYRLPEDDKRGQINLVENILLQKTKREEKYQVVLPIYQNEEYIREHVVQEQVMLPGALYLEFAKAYADHVLGIKSYQFSNVSWDKAFIVHDEKKEIKLEINRDEETVFTFSSDEDGICATGNLSPLMSSNQKCKKWNSISEPDIVLINDEIYNLFSRVGIKYGRSYQVIEEIKCNIQEGEALLRLKGDVAKDLTKYAINPYIIDGAFQSVMGILINLCLEDSTMYLPFALKKLIVYQDFESECIVKIKRLNEKSLTKIEKFNMQLLNKQDMVIAEIEEFAVVAYKYSHKKNDNQKVPKSLFDLFDMLENGKISIDDAEKLMEVLK